MREDDRKAVQAIRGELQHVADVTSPLWKSIAELLELDAGGGLSTPISNVIDSIMHMHCNRCGLDLESEVRARVIARQAVHRRRGRSDAMISEVARPIHRERVSSRFARASEFPLTVVVAPAGCGKSTALEQYLAGVDEPSAIYRVRPGDSTLAQFILGLAQAVGSVFPLELAEAIVKAHANQPVDAAIERMAQVCAMHLRAQGGVLVLDDLHYAQSSEIAQFIHEVVLETKDSLRWILATRSRESLPVGSWLARDLCDLPIDEEALLFTREDVTALALPAI